MSDSREKMSAAARVLGLDRRRIQDPLVGTLELADPVARVELRLEEVARNRDFMCGRYSAVR